MIFAETRGNDGTHDGRVSFSAALLSPIASFGGIYSPESMSPVGADFLQRHLQSSYKELALALLQHLDISMSIQKFYLRHSIYTSALMMPPTRYR